jgi:hypothetical protein
MRGLLAVKPNTARSRFVLSRPLFLVRPDDTRSCA